MHYITFYVILLGWLDLVFAYSQMFPDRRLHITHFNPKLQYVSDKGAHSFMAPGKGDSRGPCPALNAMANNGYLPRNGNASLAQTVEALLEVYGVAPDFGSVLGFLGVTFNGNGKTFTLGGWPEYITGVNAQQFKDLYDMGVLKGPKFQKTICRKYAAGNEGYSGNKTDPIGSGLLGPLFDNIVFRLMANKSDTYPQGYLSRQSLLPFFGRVRDGKERFTELVNQQRIPNNWYKRPLLSLYSVPYLAADMVTLASLGGFSNPGGNNPLDKLPIAKLSNGAYTTQDMRDPALQLCFLAQSISFILPAMVSHSSEVNMAIKATILSATRDFKQGTQSLPCQGHTIESMDLKLISKLLHISI